MAHPTTDLFQWGPVRIIYGRYDFIFFLSLSLSLRAGPECFMDGLKYDYGCKCSFSSVHLVTQKNIKK